MVFQILPLILKNAVAEKIIVPSDLGIDDDNFAELNIEGICFSQDKIYLGLESPLDDEGRSLIWVLENPSDLFNTKRLNSSSVRLWAKVRLSSFGKKKVDGIGDTVFLKNGDLIIVSGTLKGGKVWHIKSPQKGILAPKVLRSYSKLNPVVPTKQCRFEKSVTYEVLGL